MFHPNPRVGRCPTTYTVPSHSTPSLGSHSRSVASRSVFLLPLQQHATLLTSSLKNIQLIGLIISDLPVILPTLPRPRPPKFDHPALSSPTPEGPSISLPQITDTTTPHRAS